VGAARGKHPITGAEIECPPDDQAPFAALAFKVVTDAYVGRLAYLRVYSGVLNTGDTVLNPVRDRRERVGRLVRIYADRREEIERVGAGDIAAVLGMKNVFTGDTLCSADAPVVLESISFPEPVINLALEPKATIDEARLLQALRSLSEEDPTCRVGVDENTGQTILAGMGELHLEVLVDRLRSDYGVEVRTGKPRVNYKETITRPVPRVEGLFERHAGGRSHFAQVVLSLVPAGRGEGILFRDETNGASVPQVYLPSVEKGIRDAAESGFLAGNKVDDIAVSLKAGSYHELDSSELAFYNAAGLAFRDGLRQGAAVLLEPMCRLEVLVPEEFMGDILGQLAARRCNILGTGGGPGKIQVIRGMVPLSEMFGYATELRSATHGRGSFSMEFAHFAPVPPELMEKALKGIW
jgi:elongation factor G